MQVAATGSGRPKERHLQSGISGMTPVSAATQTRLDANLA